MKTTTNSLPENGLSILPDGRVQVTFENFDLEEVIELPSHIYNIIQEFAMSSQPLSAQGWNGLYFILKVAHELVPDRERFTIEAIKQK